MKKNRAIFVGLACVSALSLAGLYFFSPAFKNELPLQQPVANFESPTTETQKPSAYSDVFSQGKQKKKLKNSKESKSTGSYSIEKTSPPSPHQNPLEKKEISQEVKTPLELNLTEIINFKLPANQSSIWSSKKRQEDFLPAETGLRTFVNCIELHSDSLKILEPFECHSLAYRRISR